MKVLITGLTGFIGNNLLKVLAEDRLDLVTITRRTDVELSGVRPEFIFQGNIQDKRTMEAAFKGVDVVVNVAAELRSDSDFIKTNIDGVRNIIELSKQNGVRKIVHLSSVGVVGMQYSIVPVVIDETAECDPKNNYERSKLQSEKILLSEWSGDPERLTIIRPTNVFGEQHPRRALLNFFMKVAGGTRFVTTGTAMVNYVYVRDLAYVIRHFVFYSGHYTVYNVGSAMKFTEFHNLIAEAESVQAVCSVLGKWAFKWPLRFRYLGSSGLKSALRALSNEVVYSESRLRSEFPDIRKAGVAAGLKNTISDYRIQKLLEL